MLRNLLISSKAVVSRLHPERQAGAPMAQSLRVVSVLDFSPLATPRSFTAGKNVSVSVQCVWLFRFASCALCLDSEHRRSLNVTGTTQEAASGRDFTRRPYTQMSKEGKVTEVVLFPLRFTCQKLHKCPALACRRNNSFTPLSQS